MAANHELVAYLDGRHIGRFRQSGAGNLTFEYDEAYQRDPFSTPLSLSMSKVRAHHPRRSALPWLEGLIPDNAAARAAIAARFGVSPRNPFAILEHTGADAPGAIQLLPPGRPARGETGIESASQPLSDADVAEQLDLVIEEYRDGRSDARLEQRFSLPGAQPKLALVKTSGGWRHAMGATPTTHILKPLPPEGLRRADVVEFLTMTAARELGLRTSGFWLQTLGRHRVFVAERYDRVSNDDGVVRRLHQEDLGQSLGTHPDKKYQRSDRGPGVGEVGVLIRSLSISDSERAAIGWSFFQGLAFNSIAYCTDAHIKNYSVMLDGPRVTLAPLYDLNTLAPYLDDHLRFGPTGQHPLAAMSVGGEYRFAAMTDGGLASEAARLGVDQDRALDEVQRLRRNMIDAFEHARDELVSLDDESAEFARTAVDRIAAIPTLRPHAL